MDQATQNDPLKWILGFVWGLIAIFAFGYMGWILFNVVFLGKGSCLPSLCR